MADDYLYPGGELHLFEKAVHWKNYFATQLVPYIKGHVLECGAGIGANTAFLNNGSATAWLMLEPDANMVAGLGDKVTSQQLPANVEIVKGTIDDLPPSKQFDTIIYIDVLEHIENDKLEIEKSAQRLNPGGHLIVLAPAFAFLFSRGPPEPGAAAAGSDRPAPAPCPARSAACPP